MKDLTHPFTEWDHQQRLKRRLLSRMRRGYSLPGYPRSGPRPSYSWENKAAYAKWVHARIHFKLKASIFAPNTLYARLFPGEQ